MVLDSEFAQIADEFTERPEAIVESFMSKMDAAVGSENFWAVASRRVENFGVPAALPFLIYACVVAVDTDDDDASGFHERFAARTGTDGSQRSEVMADLWKRLALWLADNSADYRQLMLPDPGGWTRIGETVRLAFPSRRTQRILSRTLAEAGLCVESPPLWPTLAALQASRSRFKEVFLSHLEQFEGLVARSAPLEELYETALWKAVEDAALLTFDEGVVVSSTGWTLVADDDGFDVSLRLTGNKRQLPGGQTLGEGAGDHSYEYEADDALTVSVLQQEYSAGQLSTLIRGGVLPFTLQAGVFELSRKAELAQSDFVVVENSKEDAFLDRFSGVSEPVGQLDGWTVIRGSHISLVRSADLSDTPFANSWILHSAPTPRVVRVVGGVRIEGGYLGSAAYLPRFHAPSATAAIAEYEGQLWDLEKTEEGFALPAKLTRSVLSGCLRITSDFLDGPTRQVDIEFRPFPSSEKYRQPSDTSHLTTEGLLSRDHSWKVSVPSSPPWIEGVDDVIYLGARIGEFPREAADAVWEIVRTGTTLTGYRSPPPDWTPTGKSPNKGARRKWRQLLSRSVWNTPEASAAARSAAAVRDADLEDVDGILPSPPEMPATCDQHEAVDALIGVLAAKANQRAGTSFASLLDLICDFTGTSRSDAFALSRSWVEGGALEIASTTRFRARSVFAVMPHFELFESNHAVHGRLSGLTLPRTAAYAREEAERLGIAVVPQSAVSPFVPRGTLFQASSFDQLRNLAALLDLRVGPLRIVQVPDEPEADRPILSVHQPHGRRVHLGRNYEFAVQKWSTARSPDYWEAVGAEHGAFFQHKENAEFTAAALSGSPIAKRVENSLVRVSCYLPLPLARQLNTTSPVVSGPGPAGSYCYFAPTLRYAENLHRMVEALAATQRKPFTSRSSDDRSHWRPTSDKGAVPPLSGNRVSHL